MKKKIALTLATVLIIIIASIFLVYINRTSNPQSSDNSSILKNIVNFFPSTEETTVSNNLINNNEPNLLIESPNQSGVYSISQVEIADYAYLNLAGKNLLFLLSKENGNVYVYSLDSKNIARVTNTTINSPSTLEVASNGEDIFCRQCQNRNCSRPGSGSNASGCK